MLSREIKARLLYLDTSTRSFPSTRNDEISTSTRVVFVDQKFRNTTTQTIPRCRSCDDEMPGCGDFCGASSLHESGSVCVYLPVDIVRCGSYFWRFSIETRHS